MEVIKRYAFLVVTLSSFIIFPTPCLLAHMTPMGDGELSDVSGQSGVSLDIIGSAHITLDSFWIGDSSLTVDHRVEFKELVIDDGAGQNFTFATDDQPITFDVGTNPFNSSQTVALITGSAAVRPRYVSVGSMVFCNEDIGSLALQSITENDRSIEFSSHAGGGCGIDFQHASRIDIAAIQYTYNNQPQSLLLSGVHFCQSASGAPEDPSTWTFDGSFKIGDMSNGNPGTLDIGTSVSSGNTTMILNAPMQGDIRINSVDFGGNAFGPCAIDGLAIHRLNIQLLTGI